jgi:2-isopropylmalate synthase
MSTNKNSNYVTIFDTTLRDGEQSPGASMTLTEKLRIAEVLEELGVDVIEAGFPIASNGDFEAVSEIAKTVKSSIVCGLARAHAGDIDRAADALRHAKRARIHTFISTSPLHMKYKLQMAPDDVHAAVISSVTQARGHTDDVEWSPEDGSRSEHDFLCRCVESAISAGAGTINIPDTVGYSVHCHNDLGLAVANSLAAVQTGARQVECTINGLGERAGNAALEEIVMALKTRKAVMPYETGIDTTQIMRVSRLVSAVTGFNVQPNKAIVGANAFAHESGIHQHGMLQHAQTYEIMRPEDVGLTKSKLVMGKHSGRHAFREKLREMGFGLGDNAVEDAFRRFKDLADKKKEVFDEDILALVEDEAVRANDRIQVEGLKITCGTESAATAELVMVVDGENRTVTATGDGPVDAIFRAIRELFPHEAKLLLYQVHAVTGGTDAQAEVTVRLDEQGRTVNGQGADTDTLVASARAYVNALNKLLVKREKSVSALSA